MSKTTKHQATHDYLEGKDVGKSIWGYSDTSIGATFLNTISAELNGLNIKAETTNYKIMNENLNLVEILKDCPKGTKLYSTVFGEVKFIQCNHRSTYPILVKNKNGGINGVTSQGRAYAIFDGECVLFPSKDQRDWSKFKLKQPKFDPKTLQPYMKVLVRDSNKSQWRCAFYSHERENEKSSFKYTVTGSSLAYVYCIPYNEETKHLVGTTDEAPEFYRYWED